MLVVAGNFFFFSLVGKEFIVQKVEDIFSSVFLKRWLGLSLVLYSASKVQMTHLLDQPFL